MEHGCQQVYAVKFSVLNGIDSLLMIDWIRAPDILLAETVSCKQQAASLEADVLSNKPLDVQSTNGNQNQNFFALHVLSGKLT